MKLLHLALVSLVCLPAAVLAQRTPDVSKVPAGPSPVPIPYPIVVAPPVKKPIEARPPHELPVVPPVKKPIKEIDPPGHAKPEQPGRPDWAGKPEKPGRPDWAGKPDHAGRPELAGRPDRPKLTPLDDLPAPKKDAVGDSAELQQKKLQEAMQKKSQAEQAQSQAIKKASDTQQGIVQNLK